MIFSINVYLKTKQKQTRTRKIKDDDETKLTDELYKTEIKRKISWICFFFSISFHFRFLKETVGGPRLR